jgi:hypothetical protein
MIEINRRLHPAANIRFLVADVEKTPLAPIPATPRSAFPAFRIFRTRQGG